MMILIDTNVWSELTKPVPDQSVVDWLHAHRDQSLLSTVVIAEIRFGIGITPGKTKRPLLERWLERLIERHEDRILPFDKASALTCGDLMARLQLNGTYAGYHDTQIAAQAIAHGHAIATRNARHFRYEDVDVIDPWEA
jgi:predicted nucleic acid-binding protein